MERTYRMYGLVPYNLSPIQQGIQFGHAVVEYGLGGRGKTKIEWNEWARNHKTFIILNGGTTNNRVVNDIPVGTLNQHLETLKENDIEVGIFSEPDLGDQLTAIVFLVDDRVFDKETYPDWEDWLNHTMKIDEEAGYNEKYAEWVESVGGEQNVFLREFLSQFRLA